MTRRFQRRFASHPGRWLAVLLLLVVIGYLQTAYAIGVSFQSGLKLVCTPQISHQLAVAWNVTASREAPTVTVRVTLPNLQALEKQGSGAQGQVAFNILFPKGGLFIVTVEAKNTRETTTGTGLVIAPPCPENPTDIATPDDDRPDPPFEPDPKLRLPPVDFNPDFKIPDPDLVVREIEVTQGIQNLDNQMPLVAGRATIVRVKAEDIKTGGVANVTAELRGELVEVGWIINDGGGSTGGDITTLVTVKPSNPGKRITIKPGGGDRRILNDWFWFRLPYSWYEDAKKEVPGGATLQYYDVKFTAEVNSDEFIKEADLGNNEKTITLRFNAARPAYLRAVPLHLHQGWSASQAEVVYPCGGPGFWDIYLSMFRYHPIAELYVYCASEFEPFFHDGLKFKPLFGSEQTLIPPREWDMSFNSSPDFFSNGGCLDVNAELKMLKDSENLSNTNLLIPKIYSYVGMVDPNLNLSDPMDLDGDGNTNDPDFCPNPPFSSWSGAASSGTTWIRMRNTHGSQPNWWVSGGVTVAHESMHDLGRNHLLCSGAEGPPNGTIDPTYPYPSQDVDNNGQIQLDLNGNGFIDGSNPPAPVFDLPCTLTSNNPEGYYGMDVYYYLWADTPLPTILPNDGSVQVFPIMGYLSPDWTAPYTYCQLLDSYLIQGSCNENGINADRLEADHGGQPSLSLDPQEGAHASVAFQSAGGAQGQVNVLRSAPRYVTVMGSLDLLRLQGQLTRAIAQPASSVPAGLIDAAQDRLLEALSSDNPSGFSLQVQDARGGALYTLPLQRPEPNHNDDPQAQALPILTFVELLPFPDGAAQIVLIEDQLRLAFAVLKGSANAPSVRVSFPNGGERLQAGDIVRWEAADADNDGISFDVLYSADGGESWVSLAAGIGETELLLGSLESLPGSEQGLIRVVAHDGFHASQDESDQPFSVPTSAPTASIVQPQAGQSFIVSQEITLSGAANLAGENGVTPSDGAFSYEWSSSVDGVLGLGRELVLEPNRLRVGQHEITLVVTPESGAQARASIGLVVVPEPDPGLLQATVETELQSPCGSSVSHEVSVSWQVSGGQAPVAVSVSLTGPDGTTDVLEDQPLNAQRPFNLSYPGGGAFLVEIKAQDGAGATTSAQASVQLPSC